MMKVKFGKKLVLKCPNVLVRYLSYYESGPSFSKLTKLLANVTFKCLS